MDCSTPGFPVQHELLEPAQIHVHQVGDAIQPSHPLSSPSPPAFSTVLVYVFCPPAAAAKSHQSCPTLCDLIDGSPPGSSVLHYLLEFAQIHVHQVGDAMKDVRHVSKHV